MSLGAEFSKYTWWGFIIGDYMKDLETSLKTCAADPVKAMIDYDKIWHRMISVAEQDVTKILPVLKEISAILPKSP